MAFEKVFSVCENSSTCDELSACVAKEIVDISKEALEECRNRSRYVDSTLPNSSCNLAAIAYVTVEQLRQLLLVDDERPEAFTSRRQFVHGVCMKDITPSTDQTRRSVSDSVSDLMVIVGRRLQEDATVNSDILSIQQRRNRNALLSLSVCFAVPGLFAFCEPAHFRATFALQLVALVVVTGYHLVRWNLWLATIGFCSCALIFAVEVGLLVLLHAKSVLSKRSR
ncbi:unnamed protein product [Soboliphyme baturini]|uniref:Transmembrane protein n=1 Tax=Soboliphyme baturini TaxID=241478 RepID=A0A183IGM4_9BILA|nr:unnamed protein product [Soboliphyme baturini]